MAKISRKDLGVIYNNICKDWQKVVDKILSKQKFTDEIDIEDSLINQGYGEADVKQKAMLKKYFADILPKSICNKINCIEDVMKILGSCVEEVVPYIKPKNKKQSSLNAYALLQAITQAYNEGWTPDFNNDSQPKYYLYFEKKGSGWAVYDFSYCRLRIADAGFGLYFETAEKALDAGKKFIDVWNDYLPE